MGSYAAFHRRSLEDREGFWAEQAKLIHWHKPFGQVLDYSRPPFARWFVGGEINLCYNAVDRHLAARGGQKALVWISTETGQSESFTYRELFEEVNRVAAMMKSLGAFAHHGDPNHPGLGTTWGENVYSRVEMRPFVRASIATMTS